MRPPPPPGWWKVTEESDTAAKMAGAISEPRLASFL
jgi:hypothetical protein